MQGTGSPCDQSNGQCACKSGTTGIKCDTCKQGFWDLRPGNPDGCRPCFEGATPNTFMYSDSSNTCQYCHPQCLQCTGPNATDCLQCRTYQFLNTCVATCPTLFFPDSDGICRPCNSECAGGCSGTIKWGFFWVVLGFF